MAVHRVLRAVALLASFATAAPSPQNINAELTILMNNDLLGVYCSSRFTDHMKINSLTDNEMPGASSPYIDSAVILLGSSLYEDAVAGCEALSERLWSPGNTSVSIQTSLDYLVYEGKATKDSQFWVASAGNDVRAISASGQVSTVSGNLTLAALCTQSAPLATAAATDNNFSEWQISVRSNNEDLVGLVINRRAPCFVAGHTLIRAQLPGSNILPLLRDPLCVPARTIYIL